MPFRKRDAHTHWWNEKPITDVYEALEFLNPHYQDAFGEETRYLAANRKPVELHIQWFSDGDSGGASSGTNYLDIDPKVSEQLVREQWVTPLIEKGYGWSRPNNDMLIISHLGKMAWRDYLEKMRTEARSLPKPGTHTKFSGVLNDAGYGRENYRGGEHLYFDFVTPMQERVRVYPAIKRVKKLAQTA